MAAVAHADVNIIVFSVQWHMESYIGIYILLVCHAFEQQKKNHIEFDRTKQNHLSFVDAMRHRSIKPILKKKIILSNIIKGKHIHKS